MSELTQYMQDRAARAVQEQKEIERVRAELIDAVDALRIVGVEVDGNVQ